MTEFSALLSYLRWTEHTVGYSIGMILTFQSVAVNIVNILELVYDCTRIRSCFLICSPTLRCAQDICDITHTGTLQLQ